MPERSFSFYPLEAENSDTRKRKQNEEKPTPCFNGPSAYLSERPPYLLSLPEPIQVIAALPAVAGEFGTLLGKDRKSVV